MWFATQDGLNRYDGKEFLVFKKSFDDITNSTGSRLGKIVPVSGNELWLITTNGRLESLNLSNHEINIIEALPGTGIQLPPLRCLLQDKKGDAWFGTENDGVIRYDPVSKKITRYTSANTKMCSNTINALYEDTDHNIWILTKKGISLFNAHNTSIICFKIADSTPPAFSSVTEDTAGNIWAGTYGNGIFLKQKKDSIFLPFTGSKSSQQLSRDLVVEAVFADSSGKIWIGTYGKGLFIYNSRDSLVHQLLNDKTDAYSIGFNDILSIYQDTYGGIWLGTDGGGVSYYNKQLNNFNLISNNNVPENISIAPIRSITKDKRGLIWIGTSSKGFTAIDPHSKKYISYHLTPYNNQISNPDRVISLLADEGNNIWVGTQGNGLLLFDGINGRIKKWFHPLAAGRLNIPDHTIWSILAAHNNNVWAGTQNGTLCLIDKQQGLVERITIPFDSGEDSTADPVRAITRMNDSVIIIGQEKGAVYLFNDKTLRFITDYADLNKKLREKDVIIKCVFYYRSRIWIGTLGKGLLAYDLSSRQLVSITEEQGLPNNTVYGILSDEKGNLWLSSNKGICRFTLPAVNNPVNNASFNKFTMADGLQSNEFNTGAYFKSQDGILFFGGINGLNYFDPERLSENIVPVRVAITDINVDNLPVKSDTSFTYKKLLRLSYQYRSIAFKFAALDFASASRYNYYYKMAGYDKDWIDAGLRNYTTYTNLPAGSYTFTVKAIIPGSDADSIVTSLAIIINPPFWKTWWFVFITVFVLGLGLYSIYRYRINQLMQLQTVRNRIATDLHDDIGSALTNINMLSAITDKKLDEPLQAKQYLKRISEEVSTSSQALDDIIWSVNSKNDTLEETIARMRRYAAELFDASEHVRCQLDFDEDFVSRKLNMEQRRDIYLIYKEALTNIYKHAAAENVWVSVKLHGYSLCLVIKDDGKGFDVNLATHRNGLKNIKSRVEKWKGKLIITSDKKYGSTLEAYMPV